MEGGEEMGRKKGEEGRGKKEKEAKTKVISNSPTSRSRVGLHPVVIAVERILSAGPGREGGRGCIHCVAARCLSTGSRRLGLAHEDLSTGGLLNNDTFI